jgi:hypothetical protein
MIMAIRQQPTRTKNSYAYHLEPSRPRSRPCCLAGMTVIYVTRCAEWQSLPQVNLAESYQGQMYQFCSLKCQEKFRADPDRYSGNHPSTEPSITATESAVQVGTEFTCPMHPEIRQPGPGNCPKCGMTLEPVMPALDEEENPELRDFNRRFWWSLPLTVIVTVLAMAGHSLQLLPWLSSKLDRVRSGDTRDLMGRMALFCKGHSLC